MRNPLKKLFKHHGYPAAAMFRIMETHLLIRQLFRARLLRRLLQPLPPPSSASSTLCVLPSAPPPPPAGCLTTANNHGAGYNNQCNNIVHPPTAYPYKPPQQDSEQVWEIDAGNNKNLKGNQKAGNVRAANSAAGCAPAINLSQNGRFIISSGGNTNYGDLQESGNVDFANIG